MDGKVAVVTGSTSGIGLAAAVEFVKRGCSVIVTGLGDTEMIEGVTQDLSSKARPNAKVNFVPSDLSDTKSIEEFCVGVDQLYPEGIDILVNNAGIQHISPIDEFPLNVWEKMLAIGMTAPFMLIKHFLPKMKKKGWGRIVNMASMMAIISDAGKAPYSACKAGICGLTRGVALEVAGSGITCNALCPGFVDTPLVMNQIDIWIKNKGITDQEEGMKEFMKQCVNKSMMTSQEVADYMIFLCSEAARGMNGASMVVDGGHTIR